MPTGATFTRVYKALKTELGTTRYRPGEHIEPRLLADELNTSITPVRDALHRLVGEGLVEAPRNDGFRAVFLTEVALRHLYTWNHALLDLATRASIAPYGTNWAEMAEQAATDDASLFIQIAAASGNPEHRGAVERLNDRLRSVRVVERRVLGDNDQELHQIADAMEADNRRVLRAGIDKYHRRRLKATPELLLQLHEGD